MKYIVKNCGCLDDMKRCWSHNRTTEYCIDNDCLIKQVIERCAEPIPEAKVAQVELASKILQLFEIEECKE